MIPRLSSDQNDSIVCAVKLAVKNFAKGAPTHPRAISVGSLRADWYAVGK